MRILFKKIVEEEVIPPSRLLDESLENDEVDLEEWAFWQGYYEDN